MRRVINLRADDRERSLWFEACGKNFSAWARRVLTAAAQSELAERQRVADAARERDRLKAAMRG